MRHASFDSLARAFIVDAAERQRCERNPLAEPKT